MNADLHLSLGTRVIHRLQGIGCALLGEEMGATKRISQEEGIWIIDSEETACHKGRGPDHQRPQAVSGY